MGGGGGGRCAGRARGGVAAVAAKREVGMDLSVYGRHLSWFSKNLTFETTICGGIAGSRYVRRSRYDGALPQLRGAVDLCHLGSAPESSRAAAHAGRLVPLQSHLELRTGAGHGRGLRRQ